MAIAFRAKSTAGAYSASNPAVTLPAGILGGDAIFILVGSKPDTAGPASASGYALLNAFTGGTGSQAADTGQTRIGILYKEAAGTFGAASGDAGAGVTVTVPGNSVSWALGWVVSRGTSGNTYEIVTVSGDDTTGASAAYSATSASNPGVTTGDYVIAACVIPTDAGTVAVDGALTNNLTQTGTTFGTATASGNLESGLGNDIAGHVRGVPVSSGTGSANLVYTVTFTGSTNTYGPTAFVRIREILFRTVNDTTGVTDSGILQGIVVNGNDDAGLTDSASTQLSTGTAFTRTVDDTTGLTDTRAVVSDHGRTPTDTAGLVDTRAVVSAHARTQDDSAGLTDTRVVVSDHTRTQSDTTGLVDTTSAELGRFLTQTDTAGLVDAAAAVSAHGRTVDDSAGITDSATSELAGAGERTVDDPAGLVDTAAKDEQKVIPDGAGLTDAGVTQGLGAEGTDPVGLTDSVSTDLSTTDLSRTVTDDAGISDLGDPLTLDVAETVDDTAGLTDSVSQEASGATTRTVDDTTGLTDTRAVVSAHERVITDSGGLVDSVSQQSAGAGTRQVDDNAGLTDSLTYSSTQTLTESLGLADAATLAMQAARTASDVLGLTDTVTVALTRSVTVTDSAGLTDSASALLSLGNAWTRFVTDPVGLTSNHQAKQKSHRPDLGVTIRPASGTTARPYAGVTSRYPFIPD